jgi:cytochrome c-type biogenesis protein
MPELEPLFFLSAFFAGTLMFLAPCTLPLLPAYLGFISGVAEKELTEPDTKKWARKHILKNSLLFVLGFSTVLIFSGLSAGFLGSLVPQVVTTIFTFLGGILIVFFGLFMMGVLKTSFLTRERKMRIPQWLTVGTPFSSYLLGTAFAVGWTPCIGPVYGTILIYVGSTQTALTGVILLAIFALGFSVPLLGMALLVSQSTKFIQKVLPYLQIISRIGGAALFILGITLLIGNTFVTNWFFYFFENLDLGAVLMPYL